MIDVLKNWTDNPIAYGQSQGQPKFLESLVSYYNKLGHSFVKTNHIQVTTGGSEAISMTLFAVCAQGEEVIAFEPYYANYNSYSTINGVKNSSGFNERGRQVSICQKVKLRKKLGKKPKRFLYVIQVTQQVRFTQKMKWKCWFRYV